MINISNENAAEYAVQKNWGCEIIFHNDSNYCGKILRFKSGAKFSMHFHIQKIETWYIAKGEFIIKYIDTKTANEYEEKIGPGTIVEIGKGNPHMLIALTKGEIFEVSTQHFDDDCYRIFKGDSQK